MKKDRFGITLIIVMVGLLFALAMAARGQEAADPSQAPRLSGGAYTISKTVVAGGGGEMQNAPRGVRSTAGQAVSGGPVSGGPFSLTSGFWAPDDYLPTSAMAAVGGRVVTRQGNGIRRARVTIVTPSGEARTTLTGDFGFFRFGDVEVGSVYIFSVSSRRFVFIQSTQAVTVHENRDDINFVAD